MQLYAQGPLMQWGWNDLVHNNYLQLANASLVPGRVLLEAKQRYQVILPDGKTTWAQLRGKLLQEGSNEHFPVVGDWVVGTLAATGDLLAIEAVLPRTSYLARRQGDDAQAQGIAANIEYVLIASSLNQDLNAKRLERFLSLAAEAKSQAIVLLTKRDLSTDWPAIELQLAERLQAPVHAISVAEPQSLDCLAPYFAPGITSALVGSSGVGKSTLINFLVGKEVLATQASRESDGRGRHTTSARSLWQTRYGGLVVDTPGMREVQLIGDGQSLQQSFQDVQELAARCRFPDCQHQSEPDCAIKQALQTGELDQERWASYQKLQRELLFQLRKGDKVAAAEEKKKWKRVSRTIRNKESLKKEWSRR